MCFKSMKFTGPFKDIIPEYIAYKQAMGHDYGYGLQASLRAMDDFFKQRGVTSVEISEAMFEQWILRRDAESSSTQYNRITLLISFSKFLVLRGFENIHIGETVGRVRRGHYVPYIFSKSEIAAIYETFRRWRNTSPGDYTVSTAVILFSLYYGCGLRRSEGLKLKMKDVDMVSGRIHIMDSKNHKSRIVVAAESLRKQLFNYCDRFCVGRDQDAYLFQNRNGGGFSVYVFRRIYRKVLTEAGIAPLESGRLPRIHDLRHTFCVHALESMTEKGFDLYTALPLLVVYLGHKSITDTEYYLRLVRENFTSVVDKSREYAPGLFPKAGDVHVE